MFKLSYKNYNNHILLLNSFKSFKSLKPMMTLIWSFYLLHQVSFSLLSQNVCCKTTYCQSSSWSAPLKYAFFKFYKIICNTAMFWAIYRLSFSTTRGRFSPECFRWSRVLGWLWTMVLKGGGRVWEGLARKSVLIAP